MSHRVHPCPPENRPDVPDPPDEGADNGQSWLVGGRLPNARPPDCPTSLQDLLDALPRELRWSVKRTAQLLGDVPAAIPLDLQAISKKLSAVSPAEVGLAPKSLANIRSAFRVTVTVSGLKRIHRRKRIPLAPAWRELLRELKTKRANIGLSGFARYASAHGIMPDQVSEQTLPSFIKAVREGSLHRKPHDLHRQVATVWNEAVRRSRFRLQRVQVPSFRKPPTRVKWMELPDTFGKELHEYLIWLQETDIFASDARAGVLAPRTIELRRNQIHAAVTALVETGIAPAKIISLRTLVDPDNFKRILKRRHELAGERPNVFNCDLARSLVELARERVKVGEVRLGELRRLAARLPRPPRGMTRKNKETMRKFNDPALLRQLYRLPDRVWRQMKKCERSRNRYTLAKAQEAIGLCMLAYTPIRMENLATLEFDINLFVNEGAGAISTLELSEHETKNRMPYVADLPTNLSKMLIEYRNHIAPSIIGRRPNRLFVNFDGTPKQDRTIARLMQRCLKKHLGIKFSPHQFRHLSVKVWTDRHLGDLETPQHFLGRAGPGTTAYFYRELQTRRATRHFQQLVDEHRMGADLKHRRRRRRRDPDSREDYSE